MEPAGPQQGIPLTFPEHRRLIFTLLLAPQQDSERLLTWSRWRRRKQHQARQSGSVVSKLESFAKIILQNYICDANLGGMEHDSVKRVTDTATLKALAHPLRARLIGSLRIDGPATASELGRKFGESSGSTSYHLRVLAAFGFIEEDPEQPNARDRRWRALHSSTYWNDRDFEGDPAGAEAVRFLRQGQMQLLVQAAEHWESEREEWGDEWAAAFGPDDFQYHLTAASLTEVKARFKALLDEYAALEDTEDAVPVALFLAAYPKEGGRQ